MFEPAGELADALASGTLADLVPPGSAARPVLDEAGRRYNRPLLIRLAGRPGTGRDTMARALRERLSVMVIGPGEDADADVDLWVHLLTGPPRAADRAALAALAPDRTLIVLGKADIHLGGPDDDPDDACQGSPELAAVRAEVSAQSNCPVVAVSALLACADLDADELDFLRELVAAGEHMPSMAAHFLTGGPGSRQRLMRTALLRRLDRYGIEVVMDLIASGDSAAADAASVNRKLWSLSGIDDLAPVIGEKVAAVRTWRGIQLRRRLDAAAACGIERVTLERLLQVPEARA